MKKRLLVLTLSLFIAVNMPMTISGEDFVAQVDDREFASIDDAVNYINDEKDCAGTVTLLDDCTATNSLVFGKNSSENDDITLDLNNHTLTLCSTSGNTVYGSLKILNGNLVYPDNAGSYAVFTFNPDATTEAQKFELNKVNFVMSALEVKTVFNPAADWMGDMKFVDSSVTTGEALAGAVNYTIVFGNTDHNHNVNKTINISLENSKFHIADTGYFIVNISGKGDSGREEGTIKLENSSIVVDNVKTYFTNGGFYTFDMKDSSILINGNTSTKTYRVCNYMALIMDGKSSFVQKQGNAPGAYIYGNNVLNKGAYVEFNAGSNSSISGYVRGITAVVDDSWAKETNIVLKDDATLKINGQCFIAGTLTVEEGANLFVSNGLATAAITDANKDYKFATIDIKEGANVYCKGKYTITSGDHLGTIKIASGYYEKDPSKYVVEGYIAIGLDNDDPMKKEGYNYKVVKVNETKIDEVNTSYDNTDSKIAEESGDAEIAVAQASIRSNADLLEEAANISTNTSIITEAKIEEALGIMNNEVETITKVDMTILTETYLKLDVIEADVETDSIKKFNMDITPYYVVKATAEGCTPVVLKEETLLNVDRTVKLVVYLPDNFGKIGNRVYIKHKGKVYGLDSEINIQSNYYGNYVEFNNPDGFSVFEFSLEELEPDHEPIPEEDPTPIYIIPNTSVR